MATQRLGKGLDALIRPQKEGDALPTGVRTIPISKIKRNPHQPRKHFDSKSLDELSASIKEKGVVTPITVRFLNNQYILIAGERRLRASKLANKKEIPAYVLEVIEESDMMEVALIENIQRENLNPIEESEAYALLQSKFNLSQNEIAKTVGKNRSTITNSVRLLQLPTDIKKSLRNNQISAGHGRAILAMKTKQEMLKLWQIIVKHNLSVRGAERLSKEKNKPISKTKKRKSKPKNRLVTQLEDELISILGTKVQLHHKGEKGGSIQVNYFSNDDLERILDLIRSIE
tara:strand:+ start:60 stop:923 length:864 start_codon:yes stop_codon:yes gene_type:complete